MFQVTDKFGDCLPLLLVVVTEPETSEDGEEIVNLLYILVTVENDHVPGGAISVIVINMKEDGC